MKKILIALSLILGLLCTNVCFAECNKEAMYCLKLYEYILDLEIALYKGEIAVIQYQEEADTDIQLITGKILRKYIQTHTTEEGCIYNFPFLVVESQGQIILLRAWGGIKKITPIKE